MKTLRTYEESIHTVGRIWMVCALLAMLAVDVYKRQVLELCMLDERMLPCVDFGHLNARTHGSLQTRADFALSLIHI